MPAEYMGEPEIVDASFAKKLERERNEARNLAEEGRLGQIPSNRVFPWENAKAHGAPTDNNGQH